MTLEKAADEIKLAVDLIAILEENEIPANIAVEALKIVLQDFQHKLSQSEYQDQND